MIMIVTGMGNDLFEIHLVDIENDKYIDNKVVIGRKKVLPKIEELKFRHGIKKVIIDDRILKMIYSENCIAGV